MLNPGHAVKIANFVPNQYITIQMDFVDNDAKESLKEVVSPRMFVGSD